MDPLLDFLKTQGCYLHPSLSIVQNAGYTRVVLKPDSEPLLPDELLACIPTWNVLSSKTTSLQLNQLYAPELELTICLMYEALRGKESRFYLYIASLPTNVPLPVTWDPHLIHWLKGTELESKLEHERSKLSDAYCHILPSFGSLFSKISMQQFLHYYTLVQSRAFLVDQTYHRLSMVPIADLFNHSFEPHTQIESEPNVCPECGSSAACAHDDMPNKSSQANETIDMRASSYIDTPTSSESDKEVFNTYGNLSNTALLQRYGFLLDFSPHDRFALDAHPTFHEHYLRGSAATSRNLSNFHINPDGTLSTQLWTLLFNQVHSEVSEIDMESCREITLMQEASGYWPEMVPELLTELAGEVLRLVEQLVQSLHRPMDRIVDLFDERDTVTDSNESLAMTYNLSQRLILKAAYDLWSEII